MNLVDLLARELESWPDRAQCIVQDFDGEVKADAGCPVISETGRVWIRDDSLLTLSCSQQSDDHSTAIITREMWQSARDKLKGETKVPKANKYGWIRHRGGKCPVNEDVHVDIRYRNANPGDCCYESGMRAGNYDWHHSACYADIMAYRVVEAEQEEPESYVSKEECLAYIDAHHSFVGDAGNPLSWRDRIHELDREQVTADLANKAATEARSAEKAELVAKLKAEGLALIEREEVVEQVDMSDPGNWLPDDLVVCLEEEEGEFTKGKLYQIDYMEPRWCNVLEDDTMSPNAMAPDLFKWHSRPQK